MPIKMSPLFIAALVIMIAITNVVQNCNHYKLSKRTKELEEWWSAHHKAIGDTAAIWRRSELATKWVDASAAQRWDSDSAIVLQPGESFTDTIYTGATGLPSWTDRYAELSKRIQHWLDTAGQNLQLPIMKSGDAYYDTTDHRIKFIP